MHQGFVEQAIVNQSRFSQATMGLRQKAMFQAKRIACAKARGARKLSVLRIPHRLAQLENGVWVLQDHSGEANFDPPLSHESRLSLCRL